MQTSNEIAAVAQNLADALGASVVERSFDYVIKLNDERGTYVATVSRVYGIELLVHTYSQTNRRWIANDLSGEVVDRIKAQYSLA